MVVVLAVCNCKGNAMQKLANFINGEQLAPLSGEYIDNVDPSIGQVYSLIPDSDASDVEAAVAAAQAALPLWAGLSIDERAEHLARLADAMPLHVGIPH